MHKHGAMGKNSGQGTVLGSVTRALKPEEVQRFNTAFGKVNMQNILKNRGNQGNMSHSTEKGGSRSRNKKNLQQNQTHHNIMNKFDSSLMDMHFRTTTSVSTQQSKNSKTQNLSAGINSVMGTHAINAQAMNLLQANLASGPVKNMGGHKFTSTGPKQAFVQ